MVMDENVHETPQ